MNAAIMHRNVGRRAVIAAVLGVVLLVPGLARPVLAASLAEELVEESRFSIERMLKDDELPQLKRYVTNARALLSFPNWSRAPSSSAPRPDRAC